jgi:ribonucleotide reductase alpha subunit
MATGKFMPNSPTIMNAGRRLGMLSACFVLPVEDDLKSIFESIEATALVQRAGGGTGFNFSKLRPNGSIVGSSGGTTAGPLSFIDVFSQATSAIQQGAFRRGANMGILDCDHPDIIDFIKAKSDLKRWQNYNVSVAITDKFMAKVKDHRNFQHRVQHEKWGKGALWVNDQGHVKAVLDGQYEGEGYDVWTYKDTWNLICLRAWETGEPGLFFVDRANKNNPVPHLGKITATNPCVVGDTPILTINGPVTIKELSEQCKICDKCDGEGELYTSHSFRCLNCKGKGYIGKRPLIYAWDPESKLPVLRECTPLGITKRNAKLLEITFDSGLSIKCTFNHNFRTFRGDKIEAQDLKIGQSIRAFSVSKHRDGHLRAHGYVANRTMHQWVHRMVWEFYNGEIPEGHIVHHKDKNPSNNSIENLELLSAYEHQSEHYSDREANGFGRHGWKTDPKEVAKKVSQAAKNHKVVSIKTAKSEDVYNLNTDDVHTYIIADPNYRGESDSGIYSGIVSCNCGEQNLHDNDSCNLGSINLSKFINKTSSSHVAFNNLELEETVAVATRFLDNVITVNNYPLPQIEEQSKLTRRIGLGVMGWADMLFALGIPYGSPESLSLAKNIMACISNKAERVSRDLGKEKGSYTANKSSGPMRNSYRTTVAPTGTISIIADCSGGIEPIFALAFKREVMPDSDGKFVIMTEFNPYFKEALEKLSEIDAKASKDLEELAEKTGSIASYSSLDLNIYASEEVERMKQVFVTSHDIPWASHIDMQGAWQKYVDSCISKTINLSRDSNPDSISDTYTYAYDQGCNGITVYRDGSRENKEGMKQPMKVAHSEQPKVKEKPKKSPETQDVLPAHRLRVSTPFGNLHVMITVDPETDEELEIFAQLGKSGEAVAADLEGMCRMASLYLREGGSIHSVYDQWSDIGSRHMLPTADGKISSLPDALAKGLKKYLSSKLALQENSSKVNETEIYRMECPSCGKKGLQLQEGCKVCVNCGYSAC